MRGRPSSFTAEIGDAICERIAAGEGLRTICEADDMPATNTVQRWLRHNDDFRLQYVRAREDQADTYFDRIVQVSNTPMLGEKVKKDKDGNVLEVTVADMVEHRRLHIDALKWAAGKLRPKAYGEKVQQEISGPDGGPIETAEISATERARRIAFALAKGAKAPT